MGHNGLINTFSKQKVLWKSVCVYYVYLKVTKGHNSISSWSSAPQPGDICPQMQVHILVKLQ